MKHNYIALYFKKLLLFNCLLFSLQFYSQTTITFDDQGWADEELIGTSVVLSGYTFSATEGGGAIQLKVDNGNSFSGLALVSNNVNFVDGDILKITKSGGSFDFQTFHYSGADFISSITVTGYKSSSQVATQTDNSPGASGPFTLSEDFNDVDEIRIVAGGGFGLLANLDQFVFDTAVPAVSTPTVTTTAASSITTTSATLGGNVTADGGATVTERGIVYSTSDTTPTIAEGATKYTNSSGTGIFSETVSSLTAGTTHYINSYAINSAGTSYGTATSFTTSAPSVTLGISDSPLAENGGVATVTATINAVSSQTITVTIDPSGTAAGSGVDYTLSSPTITINPGTTTGTAIITGANDTLDESTETVIIDITGVANGTESGTQQVTATITDDDPAPSVTLSLSDSPLAENGGVATVTATLSAASSKTITVTIDPSGTAAGSGVDYTLSSSTITINAGDTIGIATITGANDALDESTETVIIDITGVANGTESGTQQVTATIIDDDPAPSVTLSLSDSPLAENGGVATITATLSAASSQTVTVTIAPSGTAMGSGNDYILSSTTIIINVGDTTGTATITGADNAINETNETVIIDITGVVNGTESGTQQVTATIIDDDVVAPTVTTTTASAITSTTVTLAGNATADGGASITEKGYVYAITAYNANPIISGTGVFKNTDGTGIGAFSKNITDLIAGTEYSYKSYAINSSGTSYGTLKTFATPLPSIFPHTITFNLGLVAGYNMSQSTSIGEFTFNFTSIDANDFISADIGTNPKGTGSGSLYDSNITPNDITKWTISKTDGTEFKLTSLVLKDSDVGASTSGTIKAYRDGAQVGATVNINFDGLKNLTANTDFENIDQIQIEAADFNIFIDDFTYAEPVLSIPPTIAFANINKTYGDANFDLAATSNSGGAITYAIVPGGTGTATLSGASNKTVTLGNTGTVIIQAIQAANGVYTSGTKDITLTIGKATLTATADNKTKAYGDANPAFSISYAGFKNSETSAVLTTVPTTASIATTITNVGTVDIDVAGGLDDNYDFIYVKGTLTIGKATLTITADDKVKIYGDSNPAFTISYNGFKNLETQAILTVEPTASSIATTTTNVGTVDIDVAGGLDNNYDFIYVKGTLTIEKTTLTVTADDKSKAYGDANPVLTASYSGFVNGEGTADFDSPLVLITTALQESFVGSYPITASGADDINYNISFVSGTLTVTLLDVIGTDANDGVATGGTSIPNTAEALNAIPNVSGAIDDNLVAYQAYINANVGLMDNPATEAQVQLMIDTVNATLSIDNVEPDAFSFSFYPNPAKNTLHIKTPESQTLKEIILYDLNGKKVLNQYFYSNQLTQTIDISRLIDGVYFIKLATEKQRITKKMIIKK